MNVSAIQLVKVRTAMQEVPDDSKSEAFVLLAECFCELAGREKPLAWQVPDPRPFDLFRQDAERICAEHMPPAGHAGPTPQPIRDIIGQIVTQFRPRIQHAVQQAFPPQHQGITPAQQNVVVVNVEAQERAEKFITLPGGTKLWRRGDDRVQWMLPHFWVQYIAENNTEMAVTEWQRQIDAYFKAANAVVTETHHNKYARLVSLMKQWLRTGHGPDIASTTFEQYKTFLTLLELLLETFLLSRKPTTAGHGAQTSKFWTLIEGYWARSDPIDHLKALQEAKDLKDASFRAPRQ